MNLFANLKYCLINNFDTFDQKIWDNLVLPEDLKNANDIRKNEFLRGRYCAFQAIYQSTGKKVYDIGRLENRAPIWPQNLCGSITHSKSKTAAVVANINEFRGIGIDLEIRTRVKEGIEKIITNPDDVTHCDGISANDLLMLTFSAKESLYKAISPLTKSFFGFEAAAISAIDLDNGIFYVKILQDIGAGFGPDGIKELDGQFIFFEEHLLTILKIGNEASSFQ